MEKPLDIRKLFDDKSEIYAQARPRYPTNLYEWLVKVCLSHRSVLDVGCGSGQAAIDLSYYFETVEAIDISSSQIAQAPNCDRVRFSVQSAEATNFAEVSFDAVCVAQALHWFIYERFWPEVKRVLKPNGIFAAWGYSWPHISPSIDDVLDQSFLSVIKSYWAPQNKLLWNRYRDVPFPFERIEVPNIELIVRWTVNQFFAYLHSWSATRLCMNAIGNDFFNDSYQRICRMWGSEIELPVSMDFVAIAGRNVV